MNMKPSGKGKSRGKAVAKGKVWYNGVALPSDATQRRRMRNKLSAQVHRKRKQDALDSAKQEVEGCDDVTNKLKVQLNDVSPLLNGIPTLCLRLITVTHWRLSFVTLCLCRRDPK